MGARWRVFWAETLPERDDVARLLADGGCEVVPGRPFADAARAYTDDELIVALRDVDGAMVVSRERWTRRVMEACPRLVTIAKLGIGVERIDVAAATELGVLVSNTPLAENWMSVAEQAVGAIVALAKNFKAGDRAARERRWRGVTNLLIRGKTVGIVGVGRIGSRVAALLRPFDVRLLGYDPNVPDERLRALGVEPAPLDRLLAEADFVTVHAVVTRDNAGMIGARELARMKPTAYFVNTARGALVDEAALTRALAEGRIAGAALDVFEPEPPGADSPLLGAALADRTLLSPHTAGVTGEGMWLMPLAQATNCVRAVGGELPEWIVNPDVLPRWRARRAVGRAAAP
jgi:phosphoglycerate dehydrogenase-like enzyme